ncbi:hypothetical protein WJX73_010027 [Symbiochloris irregularis]|uniref:Peptidase S49 domain-containing protein n=1 Tax=Symbiochloris irregularis TaxID=706552 RepID=A0AAW1PVH9_9CHLO
MAGQVRLGCGGQLVSAYAPFSNRSIRGRVTSADAEDDSGNGKASTSVASIPQDLDETAARILPEASTSEADAELEFVPRSGGAQTWTRFKLIWALPWRRFKKGAVLILKLGGGITEKKKSGFFSDGKSMPQIIEAITKAANDPRVSGIYLKLDRLDLGWAKVQELARHIRWFRKSGKFVVAFMEGGGEKEYFLASAGGEVYVPPSAGFSLKGFAVSGSFLRGVLDKLGVEPQVQRIGKYKSAGDQLLRKDMSEEQRYQLTALLDAVYDNFVGGIASAWNKSEQEVKDMVDSCYFKMEDYLKGGWLTGLRYESEVLADLKKRTDGKEDKPLKKVLLKRYSKVRPSTFGLVGKDRIAVIRASGTIVGGESSVPGDNIQAAEVIKQLKKVRGEKSIKALVLRVDSPGGDALASDLMWHEIKRVAEKKPVIASMADVAASGGYYMAMGAHAIVAEALTITGSIGVVAAKFNLATVYERAGFNKTIISRGRYAELLGESRGFTDDELDLFERSAAAAYTDFRDKAAASRGLPIDHVQGVAQGRVWAGKAALGQKLVDSIGGITQAIALAKKAADIDADKKVRLVEMSFEQTSLPQAILSGSSLVAFLPLLQQLMGASRGSSQLTRIPLQAWMGGTEGGGAMALLEAAVLEGAMSSQDVLMAQQRPGKPLYLMPDFKVDGAGNL